MSNATPNAAIIGGVIPKPWGRERIVYEGAGNVRVKQIEVNAGARLSLQHHERKVESVMLESGQGYVETYPEGLSGPPTVYRFSEATAAQLVDIPAGLIHRMGAVAEKDGGTGCGFIELSRGEDSDIVRWQDDYGRAEQSHAG